MKTLFPYIRISYYDRGSWHDIEQAATSFTHSQDLGNSVTQFSLTLKALHPLMKNFQLKTNDMLRIWLSNDGTTFHPIVFPGFISRITEKKTYSGGAYTYDYAISGMDIGKFLIKHSVTSNLVLQRGIDVQLDRHNVRIGPDEGTSPYTLIKKTLKQRFFEGVGTTVDPVDLVFVNKTMPRDNLDIDTYFSDPNEGSEYQAYMFGVGSWIHSEGTILQLIHQFSDPLFNELFIRPFHNPGDVFPLNALVFRRKPFYCSEFPSAWTDLKTQMGLYEFSVDTGMVESSGLGLSDDVVYTYWLVSAEIESINNDSIKSAFDTTRNIRGAKVRVPIFDRELLSRYGFSQYMQTSPFMPVFNLSMTEEAIDVIALATLRIWEYNCLQHEMYDGQITIKGGAPGVYVGTAAKNADDKREYYVQGVSHTWSPGTMKTTLQLTRGIEPEYHKQRLTEKMAALK